MSDAVATTVHPVSEMGSVRTVRGAGLGLYLSNGLVTAHGGRMWAESLGHGCGSTFCFTLPLHAERAAEPALKERA